ncbi:hypothetical protein GCM10025857_22600 [Alicyclobacillus contaminans]|nr:hypothetical protein GCM10025857_22600 [Alicyclobacillus contaminans]
MQVDNLGVPGWESADVLHALQTTKFRKAIAAANVVTLDIGSNDLLHTSYDLAAMANTTPPAKNQVMSDPLFQQSLAQYSKNLPAILTQLRTLTKAPIVLLNLYNPFPDGSDLHAVAEQVVAAANQVIYATAARFDVPVADIHSVFNHQQATDVRIEALDIHPTVTGQQAIADAVEDVLSRPLWHQPLLFAVSTKGTLVYSTTRPGPFAIYWLSPDDGLPVTGEQNGWVTVTTPNGQKGYVPADKVTVLLRADPDVQFDTEVNEVAGGLIVDSVSERASSVWLWKNTLYAPVTYLAKNANATVTYNAAEHEVDIDTPQHSGLVQTGLLNPLPVDAPYPVPHVVMQIQLDGKTHRVTAEEAGIEVVIDGNPVNLQAPALWIQGQVYVPILTFWSDLGGTITHDAKGLPILSAGAS